MEKILEVFNKYVDNYDKREKEIKLKYDHSVAVMGLMGELAYRLGLSDKQIKIARLIGLLHDIGRFPQWEQYKTFEDANSIDHADASADYLFKEGHIRDFIDDTTYDKLIEKAIRNHNKYVIEDSLSNEELMFSKMIRDTDKIDIYKQVAINFDMKFDAKEVNEKVLEDFKNEKMVKNGMCKSDSDYTLRELGYIFDINFNESFDLLVETDNFDLYLSMVDVAEDSEKLWNKVKELCFDKINRGV